ncbi:MAG TPA: PQQ-binding-like beta-propeller repeat protein, partial [Candidatus Saccharimonadales bacterium]|nr:PQQ-binding-like beta-propeller repeat protein [Candidatus Saccharimonadales bacterium]
MTPNYRAGRYLAGWIVVVLWAALWLSAQEPGSAVIYKQQCALCHESSAKTRAPAPAALRLMSPENILRSLETGRMKDQGSLLRPEQRRALSEFLSGKPFGQEQPAAAIGLCKNTEAEFSPSANDWNGWAPDLTNARFQPAERAGLTAEQVPRLKVKWAFAFPNSPFSWGSPTITGGRLFVPSANRLVYALDANSGCQYWSYESDAPARTAIVIAPLPGRPGRYAAYFGDQKANAYALDAVTGKLLWKVRIDSHPRSKIVGALEYFAGRVIVPLTGGEEVGLGDKYECCSSRGGLVALDAATGKQLWKTYSIAEDPHPTTKTAAGIQNWGPSGASIWSAPTIDTQR